MVGYLSWLVVSYGMPVQPFPFTFVSNGFTYVNNTTTTCSCCIVMWCHFNTLHRLPNSLKWFCCCCCWLVVCFKINSWQEQTQKKMEECKREAAAFDLICILLTPTPSVVGRWVFLWRVCYSITVVGVVKTHTHICLTTKRNDCVPNKQREKNREQYKTFKSNQQQMFVKTSNVCHRENDINIIE